MEKRTRGGGKREGKGTGRSEATCTQERQEGRRKQMESKRTPTTQHPHILTTARRKKETLWHETSKKQTTATTAEASQSEFVATPPHDGNSQEATDEVVTLSSASSPFSRLLDGTCLPFSPPLGSDTAATVVCASVNKPSLPSTEEQTAHVSLGQADAMTDRRRSEEMLYYLEAARALREVTSGVEAREQCLRDEIERQSTLHEAKKLELVEKQKVYERIHESTLRLTRHVRRLDSENDRIRDRLTQLQVAIEKLESRKLPRHIQQDVDRVVRCESVPSWQGAKPHVGSGGEAIVPMRNVGSVAKNTLMTELETYTRKLRSIEARHDELLKELQLAIARRKGRVAAYNSFGASLSFSGYSGMGNKDVSFLTDSVGESIAIQQLERMIDDSLIRCK
ncbi:hypothetical protein MOQ_006533 [Trypanosoma cruzi marinkellei]|uniref:Uncharacterized protein n=1 Tax=Trypanosoma cruzi marinkellei TaxID=85056 RepID=K2N4S4_TRYCR|nr:hypothetical protein MOQ_006533 [Trypanosoma cruzi marinkellei]